MSSGNTNSSTPDFAAKAMRVGLTILVAGLVGLIATSLLTGSQELLSGVKMASMALMLIGAFAFSFGFMVWKNNKSPRTDGPDA